MENSKKSEQKTIYFSICLFVPRAYAKFLEESTNVFIEYNFAGSFPWAFLRNQLKENVNLEKVTVKLLARRPFV